MKNIFIHPEMILVVKRNNFNTNSSESERLKLEAAKEEGRKLASEILESLFNNVLYGKIESHFNTERLNSDNFSEIRESVISLHHQRNVISVEGEKYLLEITSLKTKLNRIDKSFFRFLFKNKISLLKEQIKLKEEEHLSIKHIEEESYLKINFKFDQIMVKEAYSDLISAFTDLKYSHKIWDMIYSERNSETKAAAGTTMERSEVRFKFDSIKSILTNEKSFCFENFNGGDFYFYPSFIIYFKNHEDIAIIDYNDLIIKYSEIRYLEESQNIPNDTFILGETWYRVNKDGSPDRRFTDNFQIPIVSYGSIQLQTISGINELYYISDPRKAKHFCEQYYRYQDLLK
ncbi:hypothetical protein ACS126_01000 [Sphingobacterium lactis]|uniref:hypothetical protein n=1 Tax=Sphingobacterium lactis TaxID=797291 RepID=UPI003EC86754